VILEIVSPTAYSSLMALIDSDSTGCFVYVLVSSKDTGHRTYVGWTKDLEQRLASHNAGTGARSTRGRHWILLYAERYPTRQQAMSREWHLKRDRKFRKLLIACL
jgi:putative endonuclease